MADPTPYDDYDAALLAADEVDRALGAASARAARGKKLFALGTAITLGVAVCACMATISLVVNGPADAARLPTLRDAAPADDRVFDESGRFIMRSFDQAKPMASFLPGVGGLWGIPMWLFYVNRGQAVATFGVTNKDGGIMMFNTAEKAYQVTPLNGFRTLVKAKRGQSTAEAQPFAPLPADDGAPRRDMFIGSNEMEIEESDPATGIRTNALYFTPPNEVFPALVRRVTFTNEAADSVSLEVVDGLAKVEPHGVTFGQLASMGRTMEGWMHVYNFDDDHTKPFFHLVTSPADTADVQLIKEGHFAVAFLEREGVDQHELLPIICDQQVVFGSDTTLSVPRRFFNSSANPGGLSVSDLVQTPQSTTSRTPSAFASATFTLAPGESMTLAMIFGHAPDLDTFLADIVPKLVKSGYVSGKRLEAQALTVMLTDRVYMKSGVPLMDEYIKQNYLDNVLRGGMPFTMGAGLGTKPKIYHAFSRIHGDLERDYNNFVIEPTYFSQGPGNFRDVNQNRRCDVSQLPAVHDFNVRQFLSYVQADGYNQLTVATAFFKIRDPLHVKQVASRLTAPGLGHEILSDILSRPFRPGQLFRDMKEAGIFLMLPREELLEIVTAASEQVPAGLYAHGQGGFWTDHWTYHLDLILNFLSVFPDEKEALLYDSDPVPFFMSAGRVQKRTDKSMLADNEGTVRQYDAVVESPEKLAALQAMWGDPSYVGDEYAGAMWQRDPNGNVVKVPIVSKLVVLSLAKFCILDPLSMGVEMEAGKPGWNDAMNGLPGLFGSEMPAAFELHQLIDFTGTAIDEVGRDVSLPEEVGTLLDAVGKHLNKLHNGELDDFSYWDAVHTALEEYRDATAVTFTGKMVSWSASRLGKQSGVFGEMLARSKQGIQRALSYAPDKGKKVVPTYFRFTVKRYELVGYSASRGLPTVRVLEFEPEALPLFLEGPVRHLKTMADDSLEERRAVYAAVKNSTLRDVDLSMYKISESLQGQPFEVGRMMAFNPGWLENESVWMHMSYKWYLELLRAGLYDEYYDEIRTGVVCFMDPKRFGRSPLEAASFIVSSAFPEKQLHGSGFLARLSGTTAEFLTMWNLMMAGQAPFKVDTEGKLALQLEPAIADWMWQEDGTLVFKFLGAVDVTYVCPSKGKTWGPKAPTISRYELYITKESTVPSLKVQGQVIPAPHAAEVRNLKYAAITAFVE